MKMEQRRGMLVGKLCSDLRSAEGSSTDTASYSRNHHLPRHYLGMFDLLSKSVSNFENLQKLENFCFESVSTWLQNFGKG